MASTKQRKNKKLLVGLGTTLAIGTTSTIAGFGISSLINNNENLNLNNELNANARSVTNSGYGIYSDGVIGLGRPSNVGGINTYSPESYKAIPTGYVVPAGDYLVCVDKNNPSKMLWNDSYSGWRIVSVHYLPATDKLVVFYVSNSFSSGSNYSLRVANYPNISQKTNGGTPTYTTKTITTRTYGGDNYRPDTYAMVPIFENNSATTKFMIFPKVHNRGSDDSARIWWIYDASNDSVTQTPTINYNITNQEQAIMSMGVFNYNGTYFVNMAMVRKGSTGSWYQSETIKITSSSSSVVKRINYGGSADSDFFSMSRNDYLDDASASITTPGIYYDGSALVFSHAINNHVPNTSVSGHRSPFLFQTVIYPSSSAVSTRTPALFESSIASGNHGELWTGYFDNSSVLKQGAIQTNGRVGTPLFGFGWKDGLFGFVLKDATANQSISININNTNNSNIRIYPVSSSVATVSANNKYVQIGTGAGDNHDGYGQQKAGILIPEYNDSSSVLTNPFQQNILYGANNNIALVVINQASRGQASSNPATYGWYTRLSQTSFKTDDTSKSIKDVDVNYLTSKYNIEANPYWNLNLTSINNGRDDLICAIKPKSISKDLANGSVTFELYGTVIYDQNGKLYYTNSLSNLKQNFWPEHRIATFTITGFQPVKATTISNSTFTVPSNLRTASNWGPNDFYIDLIKRDFSNSWQFKEFMYRFFLQAPLLNNPATNLPTFNQSTWTSTWNDLIKGFDITSIDQANGSFTCDITIGSKYYISADGVQKDQPFRNITFKGFRKIAPTTIANDITVTNSKWSNVNIPYVNSDSLSYSGYAAQGTTMLTEDMLKTYLWDNYFKSAYDNANYNNGYAASNSYVSNLAYNSLNAQKEMPNNFGPSIQLTKDNLVFSNFKFYPAKGEFTVDIRFNIWQGAQSGSYYDSCYLWNTSATVDGVQGTSIPGSAPYGRWTIKGFRTDNVTTSYKTDKWTITGVEDIPVADAGKKVYWDTVIKAFKAQIYPKYINLPYWVDWNSLPWNEVNYGLVNVVDAANGTALIWISFKNAYYVANGDGTISQVAGGPNPGWEIEITGFRSVKAITIDSSNFFNVTGSSSQVSFTPGDSSSEFSNWLDTVENNIANYVYQQDQTINGAGNSQFLDTWKKRLAFKYRIDTFNNSTTYTKSQLLNALSQKILAQTGQLGYLYSLVNTGGIKLWVEISDQGIAGETFYSTIQGAPTDPNTGNGLTGLLDTKNIVTNIDLRTWMSQAQASKKTQVVDYDESTGIIGSIIPPQATSGVTSGMSFVDVETYLESIGYKVEYSWVDQNNRSQTSNALPTNFSLSVNSNAVTVNIAYKDNSIIPPIYIFGQSGKTSTSFDLSLESIKRTIEVDLSIFESMYNQATTSGQSIAISSTGIGDSTTITTIQQAWSNFENEVWNTIDNGAGNVSMLKSNFQIKYAVNGSTYEYDYQTMWTAIQSGWKQATSSLDQLGKLRFYSPSISQGTKIQATIVLSDANNPDFKIKYKNNKSNVIVNHGMRTSFDLSRYAEIWTTQKSIAGSGSTANNLKGFTPPAGPNGESFDDFVNAARNQLGLDFQYAGSTSGPWFTARTSVTSVDLNDPAAYLRVTANYDSSSTWGNSFNLTVNGETTDISLPFCFDLIKILPSKIDRIRLYKINFQKLY